MSIEILHIDDCPNWREAGVRLRAALTEVGAADAAVGFRLLTNRNDVTQSAFAGSPTILIDGSDLFPTPGTTDDLACRVYVSEGRLAGLPTVDELVAALRTRQVARAED